jgi:cytochrome P450
LSRDISTIWHRDVHPLRDLRSTERKAAMLVDVLSSRYSSDRLADFACLGFLTMAGMDTTCGLLGSAIHLLSNAPALQDRLRQEPAAVNGFVAETLRCCPPVKRIVGRKTDRSLTLSEVAIPQGAVLIMDIESAHHDPDAYSDPERFDPARQGPPTLAFGAGAHACVGVALARLEAKVLIDRLLHDYVILPAGDAKLRPSRDWYEFESVPIRLERR